MSSCTKTAVLLALIFAAAGFSVSAAPVEEAILQVRSTTAVHSCGWAPRQGILNKHTQAVWETMYTADGSPTGQPTIVDVCSPPKRCESYTNEHGLQSARCV